MNRKTCILLINLGTPDSPQVKDVRKYLREFLSDPRVIDINPIGRFFLVNFIIAPFRAPKSSKVYKKLWTKDGSPLLFYGESVKRKLQQAVPPNFTVELAMRYQNPSLENVLEKIKKESYHKIIILPLFPQYASSAGGSAIEKAVSIIQKWWVIPELKIIPQFFDHPSYLMAATEIGKKYMSESWDHILFSFHGVPVRHLDKNYQNGKPCSDHACENTLDEKNYLCYKATCYATARMLAGTLNIPEKNYTVVFQSRLGKDPWIEPYADQVVIDLAKKGNKKILVFSPAFVADCLETIIEIGEEYRELFIHHGGEKLQLVESLNDHPLWIDALREITTRH